MKIIEIIRERQTLKPNAAEIEKKAIKEGKNYFETRRLIYNTKKLEEPDYVVEMTSQEFQLVCFYLELERRKPIMNVKVDTELIKESDK